jgi:cobalt/nickel transport system permease protein
MHIAEGVLSVPVLISGACIAFAGTAIGLSKTKTEDIPKTAIFASAFFVASLVHIPLGGVSMHLILNGLLGILLGWSAVPAILTALFLQSILFQFGGLTALGANTVVMAAPAVICYYLFRKLIFLDNNHTRPTARFFKTKGNRQAEHTVFHSKKNWLVYVSLVSAFLCGAVAIILSALILAVCLMFSGDEFKVVAGLAIIAHIPIMVVEGIITCVCISFIKKVKPEILYTSTNNK